MEKEELERTFLALKEQAGQADTDAEARLIISRVAQITRAYRIQHGIGICTEPAIQARELDPTYTEPPHITYLSKRIAEAVRDVERGRNRSLAVSMPPRSGKSTLLSLYTPLWLLRRHPEWKIVTAAHDYNLATGWARAQRIIIEDRPDLGVALQRDGGAGGAWTTLEGGGMYATSIRGAMTGRGARVMIIDDPVRDFVEAHSASMRENLWNWWLSVAQTRLEQPFLLLVVMTRWHEDDFVGRIMSPDHEGDPRSWEYINLPALADSRDDILGRAEGQPLYSPILDETEEQAVSRWQEVRRSVGAYTFAGMYQQRPAPAKGAIFDTGWWRFWTTDPSRATDDGRTLYLDPAELTGGRWVDSWDCSFKGGVHSGNDWVVGQRWVRSGANRFLIHQERGRWSFTQTLDRMGVMSQTDNPVQSPCGHLVHERLIEDAANGPAIIDVLRNKVSGIKPIRPRSSKESRARAITPEIESGNVYLPHPGDPGNEWVTDLLSELRNFPNDAHDDQVDAMTQALSELRDAGRGRASVPGRLSRPEWSVQRNIAATAATQRRRVP